MESSHAPDDRGTGRDEEFSFVSVVRAALLNRRRIATAVLGITALVALSAGFYYFFVQPTRRVYTTSFRVTFDRAQDDLYPNGLPFGGSDVISPSVVQQVFDANGLGDYCGFGRFKGGLVVERGATERRLLDAQYEALLSNARLTPVERQRLEEEFRARLDALPVEYRLTFVRPPDCNIPSDLATAALAAILETWARESDEKRGVLRYDVSLAGPTIFDQTAPAMHIVARVDLARIAIVRSLDALDRIAKLPGALALRSNNGMTLMELRGRLNDLRERVVEPLTVQAARSGSGAAAIAWLESAHTAATIEKNAALTKTDAYRNAIREFSGTPQASAPITGASGNGLMGSRQSDGPTTIPQLDSSFIERIIQLSTQPNEYRRELTEQMVGAAEAGVTAATGEAYYEMVLAAARRGGPATDEAALTQQLDRVIAEGKRLVSELGSLYGELNKVGLRPGAAMYVVTERPQESVSRPFSRRDLLLTVGGAFLVSLVLVPLLLMFAGRVKAGAVKLTRS